MLSQTLLARGHDNVKTSCCFSSQSAPLLYIQQLPESRPEEQWEWEHTAEHACTFHDDYTQWWMKQLPDREEVPPGWGDLPLQCVYLIVQGNIHGREGREKEGKWKQRLFKIKSIPSGRPKTHKTLTAEDHIHATRKQEGNQRLGRS